MTDVKKVFAQYAAALNALDMEALARLVHPEFTAEYPQSGERFRDFSAFRAQFEHYPGGLPTGSEGARAERLINEERAWALTPGYTVLPLGGPERFIAVLRSTYPDGSNWQVINIMELRDGLIWNCTTYFAPEYEPPEWRKGLTERFEPTIRS